MKTAQSFITHKLQSMNLSRVCYEVGLVKEQTHDYHSSVHGIVTYLPVTPHVYNFPPNALFAFWHDLSVHRRPQNNKSYTF